MAKFNTAREQQAENRIALIDRIPLQTPLSMQIELASACNFKCQFCMHHDDEVLRSGKLKPGIMSKEVFSKVLDGLKSFPDKLKFITLQSRGESLLNPHFVDMLHLLKEAEVTEKVGIYTNGTLLTKDVADGLIRENLDVLHISIEGINSEQYEKVTKTKIDFEELVRKVKYFYENKINTYLYIKIIDYDLSEEDKVIFLETFQDICDDIFIETPVDAWQGAGIDTEKLRDNRYGENISKVKICPRLFFAMVVHFDGTVVACDHDWSEEYPIGNVLNESLINIWNGDKMNILKDIHLKGQADTIERCKDCIQRRACLPSDNIDGLLKKRCRMIKVSVIIPVYNKEKYLSECLDSVISQTLVEKEIICIDDGSTDNSRKILVEYANKHEVIKLFVQNNKGAGEARNRGIMEASGEFIVFMDADDKYYCDDALKHLYDKAIDNNVEIAGGGLIFDNNASMDYVFLKNEIYNYIDRQEFYGFIRYLYNKDLLINNKIFFPNYTSAEDVSFMVRSMIAAKKFYADTKIIYYNRCGIRDYSSNLQGVEDLIDFINEIANIYAESKFRLTKLWDHAVELYKSRVYKVVRIYKMYPKIIAGKLREFSENNPKLQCDFLTEEYMHKMVFEGEIFHNEFLQKISKYKKAIIYGAKKEAFYLAKYLEHKEIKILGFALSKCEKEKQLLGKPVKNIHDWSSDIDEDTIIIISVYLLKTASEIKKVLDEKGYKNYIVADAQKMYMFFDNEDMPRDNVVRME